MNDRILVLNPPVIGGRSMNDRILVLNPPVIGGRSGVFYPFSFCLRDIELPDSSISISPYYG
jgi:hypothetical protein